MVIQQPELKLFKEMLPSTAKVMFIDSMVVDKSSFLKHLPFKDDIGTLSMTDDKLPFNNQMAAYQNDFGDRRIFAKGDSAHSTLFTQTLLGDKWGDEHEITDFDKETYTMQNFPFLASDGATLFFSAEGPESMGGRDIFMSTFDSDNAQWFKPQNYGLPFNSTANDYLLVIDDIDTLGWLVTDRRQPEGKVCIYVFVPTEVRQNFGDDIEGKKLDSFARILSIKDTWQFGNRAVAADRLNGMIDRLSKGNQQTSAMRFVVNNDVIVTSPEQFRSQESRRLYQQVTELKGMISETRQKLSSQRQTWHKGNHSIAQSIIKSEHDLERQQSDLRYVEKKIRQIENSH